MGTFIITRMPNHPVGGAYVTAPVFNGTSASGLFLKMPDSYCLARSVEYTDRQSRAHQFNQY